MSWHPRPIGEGVRHELARFGTAGAMADIVAAWPAAVGESIARNAWPARAARDGTLHVATSSSAWALELTQLAPTILTRLGNAVGAGAPTAVRFAVGPVPEPGAAPVTTSSRSVPEPSRADRERAARIAAGIDDPELRELVARAAAASLAGAASGSADRSV
jgi:hypothetical protein